MTWLSAFWTETDELDDNKIVDNAGKIDALETLVNVFVKLIFF
jgi:hypothetical protein